MTTHERLAPRLSSSRTLAAGRRMRWLLPLTALLLVDTGQAQVAGQNVNMVSGTSYPDGDPFLQRQNEPSLAVSSLNPQHLIAGANDYRSVDIPGSPLDPNKAADAEARDAWIGIFKSFDGGQTWRSTLLQGYHYLPGGGSSTDPLNDPLAAAADPVMRPGTDGLVYMTGLTVRRSSFNTDGTVNPDGFNQIFVSRWIDRNNQEDVSQDPFTFLGNKRIAVAALRSTDPSVPTPHFLDKPWIAVDVPRNSGSPSNSADSLISIPACGAVYLTYTDIQYTDATATRQIASSRIMFNRSLDCGYSWQSTSTPISGSGAGINQGAVVTIEPATGDIYVVWRVIGTPQTATSSAVPDAILWARSRNKGSSWTTPQPIYQAPAGTFFDQNDVETGDACGTLNGSTFTGCSQFRSRALPTAAISMTVNGSGSDQTSEVRRLHVAWAQRVPGTPATSGTPAVPPQSRIFVSTATTGWRNSSGLNQPLTWSTPEPVDPTPSDGLLPFVQSWQFMPALTFTQGRLMLLYYDTRYDKARRYTSDSGVDASGNPTFKDVLGPMTAPYTGTSTDDLTGLFGSLLDTPYSLRHSIEVRAGAANLSGFSPAGNPVFATTRVSHMDNTFMATGNTAPINARGFQGSTIGIVDQYGNVIAYPQTAFNPPNLPLFKQGHVPFIGDYIDIAGPAFIKTADLLALYPNAFDSSLFGGTYWSQGWAPNVAPSNAPVHHAVWTTNQNVKAPKNGDWSQYTPVQLVGQSGSLTTDQTPTFCAVGSNYSGTRNQDIYTSRITEGLALSSPMNVKPISPSTTRTFVVLAQNMTSKKMSATLAIRAPGTVTASFVNNFAVAPLLQLSFDILPGATVSRSVFVIGSDPNATLYVDGTTLIPGPSGTFSAGPSATLILNPPGSNPSALTGLQYEIQGEVHNLVFMPFDPAVSVAAMGAEVMGAEIMGAEVMGAEIMGAEIMGAEIMGAEIMGAEVMGAEIMGAEIMGAEVMGAEVSSYSDAIYDVQNGSTTVSSYSIKLVSTDGTQITVPLSVLISKLETLPYVTESCFRIERPQEVVHTVRRTDPNAVQPLTAAGDPLVPDSTAGNITLALSPGEKARIRVRANLGQDALRELTSHFTVASTWHGYSGGSGQTIATPYFTGPTSLPPGAVGVLYGAGPLTAAGGSGTLQFSVVSPSWLTVSGNQLVGTPPSAGVFKVKLAVSDGTHVGTTSLALTVVDVTAALSATPVTYGTAVTLTATALPSASAFDAGTATVTVKDGTVTLVTGAPGSTLTVSSSGPTALAVGTHPLAITLQGKVSGQSISASTSASLTVNAAPTAIVGLSGSNTGTIPPNTAISLTATVETSVGGVVGGQVQFFDNGTSLGYAAAGTCTPNADGIHQDCAFTLGSQILLAGSHTITAQYGGDGNHTASLRSDLNSSPLPQSITEVVQYDTATAVTLQPFHLVQAASSATAVYGELVTAYVTVSSTTSPTLPTGSVTLSLDRPTLCSPNPCTATGNVVNGLATFTLPVLPASATAYAFSASYTPSGAFGTSASASPATLTITPATTSLAVGLASGADASGFATAVSSLTVGPAGAAVLVATLAVTSPGGGVPTGSVAFYEGATLRGSGPICATAPAGCTDATSGVKYKAGQAILALSPTPSAGSHTYTASYSTDGNFTSSTSPTPASLFVKGGTSVTLSVPPTASTGTAVQLAATVNVLSGTGTPTGTVTFTAGTTTLATCTLGLSSSPCAASGSKVTLTWTFTTGGTYAVTASYSGDAVFAGSTSATSTIVVQRATTTALTVTPTSALATQSVALAATVTAVDGKTPSPTGTVTFWAGATQVGTCTLGTTGGACTASGQTVTLTTTFAAGTYAIKATYAPAANTTFGISTSGNVSLYIALSYKTVTFQAPIPNSPAVNAGSNVPVKWTATYPNGSAVLSLSAIDDNSLKMAPAATPSDCTNLAFPTSPTTLVSVLKSAITISSSGQFQYGWNTSKTISPKGCWIIQVKLTDGQTAGRTNVIFQ